MEAQVARLTDKIWTKIQEEPADKRYIIAIAGVPGSGKSTLSATLVTRINALHAARNPSSPPIAAVVPMDGYHLTRAQLAEMPDDANAMFRRGAPWTFDAEGWCRLVLRLRAQPILPNPDSSDSSTYADTTHRPIVAPTFDHAVKNPVDDGLEIMPTHRLLLLEGNYLALDRAPWRDAAAVLDELWFIDVDFDLAARRLVARHVATGIYSNPEDAAKKVHGSDMVNGTEIVASRLKADEIIKSKQDEAWVRG